MTKLKESPHIINEEAEHDNQRLWRLLTLAAIVIGIALRVWQYAANPSIWVDEAAIARNVLDRTPIELFGRLDYAQVAPPGYLLAVKLSTALLGSSEYALRVVPFIAGIACPVLFYLVARSFLRPVATMVATSMVSMATPLIFFSSNLKQYSSDVAITLLVLVIAVRLLRSSLTFRTAFGYAIISVPLLFCSQAAIFSLTIAGAVIFADALGAHRLDRRYRQVVVALWAMSVVAVVTCSSMLMTDVDRIYMQRFWESAFMPHDGGARWLWLTIKNIFGPSSSSLFDGSFHYTMPGLFVALVVTGAVAICASAPARGALLTGPVLLTLVASWFRFYPFGARVDLFLLPLLLLLAVAGADYGVKFFFRRQAGEYILLCFLPFAVFALCKQPPPYRPEHLRPVMQYVSDHWQAGDALWVYYGGAQAFEYYSKLIPIRGDVHVGECNRSDPRQYLRQLDAERGRSRVWVLMAHGSGPFRFDERKMLLAYLDKIGCRVDQFHAPTQDSSCDRAEAFLFDLSNPDKLARSSAELFSIQNDQPAMTWSCYGTMSPYGPDRRVIEALTGGMRPSLK